jgi:hypothetical protein
MPSGLPSASVPRGEIGGRTREAAASRRFTGPASSTRLSPERRAPTRWLPACSDHKHRSRKQEHTAHHTLVVGTTNRCMPEPRHRASFPGSASARTDSPSERTGISLPHCAHGDLLVPRRLEAILSTANERKRLSGANGAGQRAPARERVRVRGRGPQIKKS